MNDSTKIKGGGRRLEIDVARGLGIILVVLGHAFPDASAAGGQEAMGNISRVIFNTIYSFHMPLFFFLAGFVAVKILDMNDGHEKGKYIAGRARRLLVPYLMAALLYLPLKIILARYANNPYDIRELWRLIIGWNPNYAMWTLWTLFAAAVIGVIVATKKNIGILSVAGILCGIILYDIPLGESGIPMLLQNFGYYFVGLWACMNYETMKKKLFRKSVVAGAAVVFILCNMISQYLKYYNYRGETVFLRGTALSGILLVLFLSVRMVDRREDGVLTKGFLCCGNYSMDIYIISTFIQPLVRIIFWSKLGLNYGIYTIFSTVMGVLIPILLSKYIIRKIPVFRKLFLGMK